MDNTVLNPTPEDIAAAKAVLARVEGVPAATESVPTTTDDDIDKTSTTKDLQEPPHPPDPLVDTVTTIANDSRSSAAVVINQARKEAITANLIETINNPRFWARESRVKALEDAIVLPMFDDRSLQQFYIHAKDDLTTAAALESSRTGNPVIMPTEVEVIAEVWNRCYSKEMELQKKRVKQDRNTEARLTGKKAVPVTDEDVRATVEAIVAKLRKAEGL